MISIELALVLVIVCSLTYSFEIIFGLAGTIMMLPVLGFFFESKTLVIYSILPQLLVGGIALLKSFDKLNIKALVTILAPAAAGGILGGYFFINIPLDIFKYLLSAIIIMAGIFMIITPAITIGKPLRHIMDFSAGLCHVLFSISGPIVMTRLLATFEDKTVIRNLSLGVFFSLNLIRVVNYAIHDSITPQIRQMFLVSAPVLIPILFFADRLHFKLNDTAFKKSVAWIIFLADVFIWGS